MITRYFMREYTYHRYWCGCLRGMGINMNHQPGISLGMNLKLVDLFSPWRPIPSSTKIHWSPISRKFRHVCVSLLLVIQGSRGLIKIMWPYFAFSVHRSSPWVKLWMDSFSLHILYFWLNALTFIWEFLVPCNKRLAFIYYSSSRRNFFLSPCIMFFQQSLKKLFKGVPRHIFPIYLSKTFIKLSTFSYFNL